MIFDAIPMWGVFVAAILVVMGALEIGQRLGHVVRARSDHEKESAVSTIAAAILGLAAFMLALAFGTVWDRYDSKKALVREDAAAIRTAWLRSDFLPDSERGEAVKMLKRYVDVRLDFVQAGSIERDRLKSALDETLQIQNNLWNMAVAEARKDMNSDVAALYIESLNDVNNIHAERISVGIQTRVPFEISFVLLCITILGTAGVGYQTGIAGSSRSLTWPVLALSFALSFSLIVSLDRPDSGLIRVSQQPLIDVQTAMAAKSGV
jgi:hypothetical protein